MDPYKSKNEVTTTETPLSAKLKRLAELKALEAKYAPIKDEINQLRDDIKYDMIAAQSKRTEPIGGYYAVRSTKETLVIDDAIKVEDWLQENTLDPDQYKKLDAPAIQELATRTLHETGEIIPGLSAVETETVSIRKEVVKKS